jgi:hypothetical protein
MPQSGLAIANFFRLTAEDLATSSEYFYDVDDPSNLDFRFGEVAEDIGDTIEDYPIVIVPGIMGSRLFNSDTTFNDSTKVWDPNQSLKTQAKLI